MAIKKSVLIIGARGHLGSQILNAVLKKDKYSVSALIREGSNASKVEELGVDIVRGDMMKPDSLDKACEGVDVVINSANGYASGHPEIDTVGANYVADAVKKAGVKRYVYCSVLTCEKAGGVEHFHNKFLHEEYCKSQDIPYIALRPGMFLDQSPDYLGDALKGGTSFTISPFKKTVPVGMIYTEDLAQFFADSIDLPDDANKSSIDVGWNRHMSYEETATIAAGKLDRKISVLSLPWFVRISLIYSVVYFMPLAKEMLRMFNYFDEGTYINDTTLQEKYFGPAPAPEDVIGRYVDKVMKEKKEEDEAKAAANSST